MAYYVCIVTNKKQGALYIGVTNDLSRRCYEHKNHLVDGFTEKYDLEKLVYYETYEDIALAIQREKQMKKWNRQWKINRINEMNPDWNDLSLLLNQ